MPAAPLPRSERRRLAALRALRVLDSAPERSFDDLTELARAMLGTPIALVSLVDEDRQWFKSALGLSVCETPRSQSVCAYVVLHGRSLAIEDLRADERTRDNPLVTGEPFFRFYAGAPITLSTGETVGSLCVLDAAPRTLPADSMRQLERLASVCATMLEARRSVELLVEADRRIHLIEQAAPVALLRLEPVQDDRGRIVDFRVIESNGTANRLFRCADGALAGRTLFDRLTMLADAERGEVLAALRRASESGDSATVECDGREGGVGVSLRWRATGLGDRLVVSIEDISESREHQRELRARDEMLRQFVESSPAAVAMLDTEMRYLVVAERWIDTYGLTSTDLIGRCHYDVFPEIGDEWRAIHRRVLAGETIRRERDRFERADGRVQWLRWELLPWRDKEGRIGGLVMFTEDITQRVEQELEIERQHELIEAAGALSRVGGWSFDVESGTLSWTGETRRIFGVDDGFVPTLDGVTGFYKDEDAERIAGLFRLALESGEPYEAELAIVTACGETRLTRSIGKPIHRDGRIVRITGSVQDVTEQVRAREAMIRDKALLEQTQALSEIGGWALDLATGELHWTVQTYRIHGLPVGSRKLSVAEAILYYTPEHRAMVAGAVDAALSSGEPFDFEADIVRADGARVPVRAIGQPVMRDGEAVRVVGVVQDLTRMRAEQEERDRDLVMLKALCEGTSDLIFVKDLEGRFLFANPAMAEFCGRPQSEILGRTDAEILPPHVASVCRDGDRCTIESGTATVIDEAIEWNGEIRHFKTTKQPYRLSDGRLVGVIALCHDVTEIRRQEDERQRLSDLIRSITDASSDVIFVKDLEGTILFGNPAYAKVIGVDPDELIGFNEYERFEGESLEQIKRSDRAPIELNAPVRIEERVQLPGRSEWRSYYVEKHPYRLPDGTVAGVLGVCRDITELRTAMEGVRVSEARLNFAMHSAGLGLWDWDLTTNETYFNETWYTMLGYEPGELPMTIESWTSICDPRDLAASNEAIRAYLAGETDVYSRKARVRCKDGTWKWIHDIGRVCEWDELGRPTRMVGLHQDIDEQTLAKDRLEMALLAANEGLWEWSIPDNRCYFDDTWYTMLGYEPRELPMEFSTWEALCHPEDLDQAREALQRYLRGEAPAYAVEHRLRVKSGEWRWFLGTGRITERDDRGNPMRVVGVNLDIDEQKHTAETLERALVAAEAGNLAKSKFLANMSHEIRTPMTAIVGYAEMMVGDPDLMADQQQMREAAAIIQRNGDHLLRIINDILDLSKVDAGKMTTESVRTDLLELTNDVIELHRSRATHKGIRLELQQRDALPDAVMADPVRVRQILMNLVSNAIKFTESGSVTLRIETVNGPNSDGADSDGADAPPRIRIAVIDTGIGIGEEQADRLFSAFQQADDSMVRRYGGTGLGLVISRRLAELMGGEVTVRSRRGSGSTFTLELPLDLAEDARWIAPGAATGASGTVVHAIRPSADALAGLRVLLVEDGIDNQGLLSHHLRKAGAVVSVASNGKEGIEHVAASLRVGQPFDLILMDMQMPVMDGYTATRTLREQGVTLPIVALTAHAMSGDRERCIEAGCDAYQTKPVLRDRLIELCVGLTRGRRAA